MAAPPGYAPAAGARRNHERQEGHTVDTITGEVYQQGLTPFEARELTDEIRQTLTLGHDLLIRAFTGRAWTALGYDSWDGYCQGEFSEARMVRLDREQRREIVAEMREAGMSTRAIASGIGESQATVVRDLRATESDDAVAEPSAITGVNGKTYQPPAPKPTLIRQPQRQREDAEVVLNRVLKYAQDAAREAGSLTPTQLARISSQAGLWTTGLTDAIESLQRLVTSITGDTR